MEQRLTELWYREPPRASLLQPLGWLYAGLVALRQRAYGAGLARSARAGRPVPPTVRLPTTTTGLPALALRANPAP